MASGGNDLSTRMSAEDQSIDDTFIYEIVLKHFKRNKVEISRAIKKEFPFLEILRDRELITDKMYEDCQESCRNLVPVHRVVYNVLNELEKKFDLPLLEALFSEVNKQEYPDLNNIYKGFENAIHEKICHQESEGEESMENLNTQLSLEQGAGENSYQRLTWLSPHPSNHNGPAPPENGLSEHLCETEQINVRETDTTSDNIDALENQQANERCAQESEPAGAELPNHGIKTNPCSVFLVDIKKEKPFFNSSVEKQTQTRTKCNQVSEIIVISSGESGDEDESPEASTWELRRRPVIDNRDFLTSNKGGETQEATCSAPKIAPQPMDFRKSPTCRKRLWKTGRSREGSSESSADEMPPGAWGCALGSSSDEEGEDCHHPAPGHQGSGPRAPVSLSSHHRPDSADIGNKSIWETSNKKRRINSGGSPERNNKEESQETSGSALRNGSGAELQGLGERTCCCIMCSSNDVPTDQEARTESSQASDMMDIMDIGSNSTLENHSGKIREKRRHIGKINSLQIVRNRVRHRIQSLNKRVSWKRSKPKGIKGVNAGPLKRGRKRGRRIPRDTNMDFQPPILPVTCGHAKGTLSKEEMKQGISAKCIKMEDGRQLTLKEFEIEGKHEKSKNWRLSVRCGGWPLKYLIQKGYLPDPPRTRKKTIPESQSDDFIDPYPENSNECEVCRRRGKLFCCDTCPRSFHEKCHIHRIDPDRNPWSCIFCQIKAIQESYPEGQPCHRESEVLERQMLPEEQLKCEFLFLKVNCCSESPFFASQPYYSKNAPQGPKKSMWLNKIRKKLTLNLYPRVKGFVQDMRLIFQNHRAFYRDHKFVMLGLQLEAKFENNFKNIFAIQEISKNGSQAKLTVM